MGYLSIYQRKEFKCGSPRCPSLRGHDRLKAWRRLGSVVLVRHELHACHCHIRFIVGRRKARLLKLTRREAAPPGPAQSGLFEAPPGLVHAGLTA
jgi:hypothetical protein